MGSRPPSSSLSITVRKGRLQLATLASGGDDDKGGTTVTSQQKENECWRVIRP